MSMLKEEHKTQRKIHIHIDSSTTGFYLTVRFRLGLDWGGLFVYSLEESVAAVLAAAALRS